MKLPIPNYIYQDEEEMPAQNTWSRKKIQCIITQEAILSATESTYSAPTSRQFDSQKFPRKLLCDLANAFMYANEELLKYRHLMARTEYRVVWGKEYEK